MERRLVLWFPDWPVTALLRSREARIPADAPIAVLAGNAVVACSAAARQYGVRRGMRRRDAQSRCPELRIASDDAVRDAREFLPVADRIETLAPGLQLIRPGLCALRIRGPARYYGGELPAAITLLRILRGEGLQALAGVADDRFTAEQAARLAEEVHIIPEGGATDFLAPLPVTALGDDALAGLLEQLGVRTLGDFAAIGATDVLDRFGPSGALLHALAGGRDPRRFLPRVAVPQHATEITFEPPLALADQVAFSMRVTAERFIAGLAAAGLSCTELRVELVGADGDGDERVWAHAASFDGAGVVDRVRWQLEGAQIQALRTGVAAVRLTPEAVGAIAAFEPGLFGRGGDERIAHALSRVQAMLGHRGVLTASVGGGRRLAERIVVTPWGDRPPRPIAGPWPGSLPAPHPASVYPEPVPVTVEAVDGGQVRVGERGTLLAEPAWIAVQERTGGGGASTRRRRRITAWAGPWPSIERGWDPAAVRRSHRFQAVDEAGGAWALLLDDDAWSAEGRYD
jgi:protein ImuB